MNKVKFCCMVLIMLTLKSYGQVPIDVGAGPVEKPIGYQTAHYYDATRNQDILEVINEDFSLSNSLIPSFGYNTGADWLRFELKNSINSPVERIIRINKAIIDTLELYHFSGDQLLTDITGSMVKKPENQQYTKSNYFKITLQAGETKTFYLKAVGMHSKQLAVFIDDYQSFINYESNLNILLGFYLGALLIITLYNLFLGFTIKDSLYFIYAASNLGILIASLTLKGFVTGYIIPNSPNLALILVPIFIIGFTLISSFMCFRMVNIKRYSKAVYYSFFGVMTFAVLAVVVPLIKTIGGATTTFSMLSYGTFLFTVIAVISAIIAFRNKDQNAKYYLIGWTVGLIGVAMHVFLLLGILPYNFFTNNLYMIGSIIEVLTFSFALADRYNNIRSEKVELERDLQSKKGDLAKVISDNRMRYKFKLDLLDNIEEISKNETPKLRSSLRSYITELKLQLETEQKFNYVQKHIDQINTASEQSIKDKYPTLTKSEVEIYQLMQLDLSIKEIARIRKTSEGATKVARYRLKKKLNEQDEITYQRAVSA